MTPPDCSDVARRCGVDPLGTGSAIRSWLLVEHPGPWPEDVRERLLSAALSPARGARLQHLWVAEGLRPLVIRRPGRAGRRSQGPRTVLVGSTIGGHRWLERLTITDLADLGGLDLDALAAGRPGHGEPVDGPVFCVCTQSSVDACCAVRGRTVVAALAQTHPEQTWEVTHLGGCRFASNLLVLPDGVMHGRLDPQGASGVAEAAAAGRVAPGTLRGRTGAGRWAGGAEVAVRRLLGDSGPDDVVALSVTEHPDTVTDEDGPSAAGADVVVRGPDHDYAVRLRWQVRDAVPSRCDPEGTDTSGLVVTALHSLPQTVHHPERTSV